MLLASLLLLALAQSLTVMIPAWAVQHIFDGLSPSRAKSSYPMELLVGAFLGGATIAFLAEIAKRRLATEISLRHAAHVRQALFVRQISSNPYRPKNKGTVRHRKRPRRSKPRPGCLNQHSAQTPTTSSASSDRRRAPQTICRFGGSS